MIRAYTLVDRPTLLTRLGGEVRTLDDPEAHWFVSEEQGSLIGSAIWRINLGGKPYLGTVDMMTPSRKDVVYALSLACAEDMRSRGYTECYFEVYGRGWVATLKTDLGLVMTPRGFDPLTRDPTHWDCHLSLPVIEAKLRSLL